MEEPGTQPRWHWGTDWDVPWQEVGVLNGPLIMSRARAHTVQFAFQFVDEEFEEETKGEFVLEEGIQEGMPRPYILLGRKEKEPRGRDWDCQ